MQRKIYIVSFGYFIVAASSFVIPSHEHTCFGNENKSAVIIYNQIYEKEKILSLKLSRNLITKIQ